MHWPFCPICYKRKSYLVQIFREFGWCQHIIWSLKEWTPFSGSGVQDCCFFWSISQWLHLFWIAMFTHPGEELFRNRNSTSKFQTHKWLLLAGDKNLLKHEWCTRKTIMTTFSYFFNWVIIIIKLSKVKCFLKKLYMLAPWTCIRPLKMPKSAFRKISLSELSYPKT